MPQDGKRPAGQTVGDVKVLPIDPTIVVFNPKNAQHMEQGEYTALVAMVKRDKRLMSVPLLRRENGKYFCVDGEHRIRAAIEARLKEIPCIVAIGMSESEANMRMLAMNKIHGAPQTELLGRLLGELEGTYGKDELSRLTSYKGTEIDDLMKLAADADGAVEKLLEKSADKVPPAPGGKAAPNADGEEEWNEYKIYAADAQSETIDRAFKHVIDSFKGMVMNPWGNALELICADYLGGIDRTDPEDGSKPAGELLYSKRVTASTRSLLDRGLKHFMKEKGIDNESTALAEIMQVALKGLPPLPVEVQKTKVKKSLKQIGKGKSSTGAKTDAGPEEPDEEPVAKPKRTRLADVKKGAK